MSARSMRSSTLRLGSSVFALLFSAAAVADEPAMLKPNWDDPEVKGFLEERTAVRGLGAEAETPQDKVQLPVLDFSAPPESATRSLRASPEPEAEPVFIYDEKNPVWYQLTHSYGDVTVTIEADLRVQQKLSPDDKVYESETRSLTPGEPEVDIYADAEEEGSPGYVGEYTVEKFGIPYTVRIECTKEVKEDCADASKIAASQALLKVTGGSPPAKN